MTTNGSDDEQQPVRVITRVIVLPRPEDRSKDGSAFSEWFYKLAVMNDATAKMEDKLLLWCLMKAGMWRMPIGSIQDMLLQELADRLYPEFDGINVIWTEYGWSTSEGEIRYVED